MRHLWTQYEGARCRARAALCILPGDNLPVPAAGGTCPLPLASAVFAAVLLRVGGGDEGGLVGLDPLLFRLGLDVAVADLYVDMRG